MIGNEEIDMKKYVKPELFYEQFELTQHIAACALDMTDKDPSTCHAEPDPNYGLGMFGNVFLESVTTCEGEPQKYCYEQFAADVSIFNS